MIKEISIILKNELLNFIRSDRGVFFVHILLIAVWSSVLATNMHQMAIETNTLGWIFFSVIVSGNFSNTTFVAERLSGSLEIVLTSGLSRKSILAGKVVYVIAMSVIFGFLCLGMALAAVGLTGLNPSIVLRVLKMDIMTALYVSACFMNAACGAWLSMRLSNPRLSHFANLMVLGIIVGGHAILTSYLPLSPWLLPAILAGLGTIFMLLAIRDFESENVVQPFSY
jgi:hypothetical protein